MLDLLSLLCVLLLVAVLGFLLGTGRLSRFSRQLAAPALSTASSVSSSTSPHAPIGFQPSLSLQPLQRSAAPSSSSSAAESSASPASSFFSAGDTEAAAAVAVAVTAGGGAASAFPSSTSSAPSPTSGRHLIVVAKHLPIKVNVAAGSDDWTVEWEDSRSFLSNLRFLSSPTLSIHWVGLAQQSFLDGSVSAAQQARYAELCGAHCCHPVLLPARLHDDFINGFCKSILWPMLHYVMPDATQCFGTGWQAVWEAYAEANSLIAAAVLRLMTSPHDCVWIHNYHLFLVPSVLRRASPYAKIGLFIHTPFPTSDIFRALPSRSALLESIMCCDLLGFHTFDYARHFLSCSKRVLDLDFETLPGGALGIKYSGRFVSLLISHVGIASDVIRRVSQSDAVLQRVKDIRQQMSGRRLLMGVEDLDAVKGPLLKLQAIDRFLSKYGDQVGRVCFVELLLLSRNYSDTLGIQRDMVAEIGRLQAKYGADVVHVLQPHDWMPMEEVLAWYRAAHVAVCSTFWDGLNLMPYEYTASQDAASPGALILSEFTGCSRSLNGVLRVNPWSLEAVADAIQQSLSMTPEERRANHSRRFTYVMNHTVERWATGFLEHLDRASALGAALHFVVQGSGPGSRLLGLPSDFHRLEEAEVLRAYRRCNKRVLFLDYDGTLIPSDQRKGPSKGVSGHPPASLLRLLSRLCEDEDSCVFLMSGRTRASLMDWFGGVQQLGLAAEKGLFLRWPKRLEKSCRMTWGESSRMTEDEDDDDDAAAADGQQRTAGAGAVASPPQPPVVRSLSLQMSSTSPSSSPRSPSASSVQADSWEHMVSLHDVSWKAAALDIIRSYTEQTDGSWIEDKEFAIVWHYEQADEEYGRMQATDLHKYLTKALNNPAVDIVKYEYSSCLTGDHRVLTRGGWQSIKHVQVGDEVLSFNTATYVMEWKPVLAVQSHAVDPANEADALYRVQDVGMDVIATRDHRMLVARLSSATANGLRQGTPVGYETVGDLLRLKYQVSAAKWTRFSYNNSTGVVFAGFNTQPGVKVVVPGLEQVCNWWWQQDEQVGFLTFLGFWLGDGYLNVDQGRVCIGQKKEAAKQWLSQTLLPRVFPRWWYSNPASSADPEKYIYNILCPPLYNYLRLMAVGPAGYNPRDPTQLRSYPHFTADEGLAAEEQQSDYYKADNASGYVSRWTEAEMLAAFTAEQILVPPGGGSRPALRDITRTEANQPVAATAAARRLPVAKSVVEASAVAAAMKSKDEQEAEGSAAVPVDLTGDDVKLDDTGAVIPPLDQLMQDEDERPRLGAEPEPPADGEPADPEEEKSPVPAQDGALAVQGPAHGLPPRLAGKVVWWNNGLWIIIDGHWFYLKRWLGDQAQMANVYSRLSRQQAVALLEGFCRADGKWKSVRYEDDDDDAAPHEPTGQWTCSNSSFPLIDQLMLIGQLAGAAVYLHLHNKGGKINTIDGRLVTMSVDHWALFFTFSKPARTPMRTTKLAQPVDVSDDVDARGYYQYEDDGKVYDITVQSNDEGHNSNFLTQRLAIKRLEKGSTGVRAHSVFVGNCLEVKPHGVSKGNAATAICEALLNDREKERSLLYAAQDAAAASLNLRLSGGFHRAMTAPAVVSLPELSRALPPPPFRQSGAAESSVMFLAVGDDRSDEDMFVAVQGRHWKDEKLRVGRLKEQAGMRRGATAAAMEEKEQQHRRLGQADAAAAAQHQPPPHPSPHSPQAGSGSGSDDVFTVCVGLKPSAAHYYLEDDRAVVRMLHALAGSGRRDSAERRTASAAAQLPAEPSVTSASHQDGGDGLRHRKKASREMQQDRQ